MASSEETHPTRGRKSDSAKFAFGTCPACPEIKKKIDRIDLALLGPDGTGMKEGIVHAITQLQKNRKVETSWVNFAKPVAVAVVSSLLTFALAYGLLSHAQLMDLVSKLIEK